MSQSLLFLPRSNVPQNPESFWFISRVLKRLILTVLTNVLVAFMKRVIFRGLYIAKWFNDVQLLLFIWIKRPQESSEEHAQGRLKDR